MKSHSLFFLAVLLALALILSTKNAGSGRSSPFSPGSQADAQDGFDLVFEDDFETGGTVSWDLPAGWAAVQETGNTFLRADSIGTAVPVAAQVMGNYRFLASLRLNSGTASLWYRRSFDQSGYRLELSSAGLELYRRIRDESETLLASSAGPVASGAWHALEVSAVLGHLQVKVDGQTRLDLSDPQPWYAGGIGLGIPGGQTPPLQVDFDDIQVWEEVAPEAGWEAPRGPSGGLIAAVEIDPANPSHIYAAGGGGTVWQSMDGGAHWTGSGQLIDFKTVFQDLVLAPSDPQTVYALAPLDAVVKTSDAGQHWTRLDGPASLKSLALSPQDASRLVAGTADGKVFLTLNGGASWSDITADLPAGYSVNQVAISAEDDFWAGLFSLSGGSLYHSTDGGLSWEKAEVGALPEYAVKDIFVDPGDPLTLYVGFSHPWEGGDPADPRLFVTTNGGATWAPFEFPFLPGGPAIIAKGPDGALYLSNRGNIHYTLDGGETWETVGTFPALAVDPTDLAVHPSQSQVLYLPCRANCILESSDHGASWQQIQQGIAATNTLLLAAPQASASPMVYSEGFASDDLGVTWQPWGPVEHPFIDEITVSPFNPRHLWSVADRGDVYTSTDGGGTWDTLVDMRAESRGFRFGSVYALAASPTDPERIYALRNGMGIFSTVDAGLNWSFLYPSLVDYSYSFAVDPADPDILYSGYTPKPFQDWAMVRKTSDGGETWTTALTVEHSSGITAVALDPQNTEVVYAGSTGTSASGGGQIYRSEDGGDSWAPLNPHFNMLTVTAQPSLILDPENPDTAYVSSWLGGTWKTTTAGAGWSELDPDLKSVTALSLSPSNPAIVYAADRTRPVVWISLDGGATWGVIADFAPDGAALVSRVLAAPGNTVYAATFTRGAGIPGGRLYKSPDGGATWDDITGSLPRSVIDIAYAPTHPQRLFVTTHLHGAFTSPDGGATWQEMATFPDIGAFDIEVDPANALHVLAAGMGGVSFPDYVFPGGYTLSDPSGLYRSTDGGSTWEQVFTTTNASRAVRFHPFNPNLVFVASADDGLLASADGGGTWTAYNTGLDTLVLTSVAVSGSRIYVGTEGAGVYAGDIDLATGAVTWQAARSNQPVPSVYSLRIAVDPTDSDRLYVSANPGGLFRSDDGGLTFYDKNFATPSVIVDDPVRQGYYSFALDPQDPETVWLGTYGRGVYRSEDGMNFDAPANGSNGIMFGKHINAVLVDPTFGVVAASEEGVYRTTDEGETWQEFSTGLDTPQVRTLAVTADGILLAGTAGYELYARAAADEAWQQMNAFGDWGKIWSIWDNRPNYQFTALLFHPTDPQIIYFGTFPAGIFKSTDGGQSWLESNTGWTFDGVFSMRFHPDDPETLYVGTYNGVNRSTDGGAHWQKWDAGWPAEQWVYAIDFDPRDPQVMIACSKNGETMGQGRPGFHGTVMKTLDGGATWFPITSGLNLNQEFYECMVDRFDPDTYYLATQSEGVFISRNGGGLWQPFNTGLANPYAATNGNHVSSPLVLSASGRYLYFGSAGSGVLRRRLGLNYPIYLPRISR